MCCAYTRHNIDNLQKKVSIVLYRFSFVLFSYTVSAFSAIQILSWLDTLHTGDKVIVENIGKSYLSKDLKVIKVGVLHKGGMSSYQQF